MADSCRIGLQSWTFLNVRNLQHTYSRFRLKIDGDPIVPIRSTSSTSSRLAWITCADCCCAQYRRIDLSGLISDLASTQALQRIRHRLRFVARDPINVASKAEGLTRNFQVDLLITEEIRRMQDERFVLRAMLPAQVKGKALPIQTYYVEPAAAIPQASVESTPQPSA